MPALRRNAKPLLRTVNGRPHASDDDHESSSDPPLRVPSLRQPRQLPTPDSSARSSDGSFKKPPSLTEEDINAEPLSSEDEKPKLKLPAGTPRSVSPQHETKAFKTHERLDGASREEAPAAFRRPGQLSQPPSASNKRPAIGPDTAEHPSSESDDWITSSQSKRRKTTWTKGNIVVPQRGNHAPNLFAAPPKPARSSQTSGYGTTANRKKSRDAEKKEKEFKRARALEAKAAAEKKSVFRKPGGLADLDTKPGQPTFRTPGKRVSGDDLRCDAGASSELSSPTGSVANLLDLDLDDVEARPSVPEEDDTVRTTHCAICESDLPATLREDFEDTYSRVKRNWTYKWQERFCRWHKTATARQTWEDRAYPTMDWDDMPKRLRREKHMDHIQGVLEGTTDSIFRRQFEDRVKGGKNKSLAQAMTLSKQRDAVEKVEHDGKTFEVVRKNADARAGVGAAAAGGVGYYGPRGEKLFTDHILSSFSSELRKLAAKDKLIAASGVSGGVSGWVQAVLVPELALSLVREDLGSSSPRDPVEVLGESTEVGELLHPELAEKVQIEERDVDEAMDGL